MTLEQVTADIAHWIQNFLEVANPDLDGWAPCPYARQARLSGTYQVRLGNNILFDLIEIAKNGLAGQEVIVLAYPPDQYTGPAFELAVNCACEEYLLDQDLIALTDHPDVPELVNGVRFNQGQWALIMIQSLSQLDQRARALGRQGFYAHWPESYLAQLFQHRQDPRP